VVYKTLLFVITFFLLEGCGTLKTINPPSDRVEISYAGHKSYCESIPRVYSGTFFQTCKLYGEPNYSRNTGFTVGGLPIFLFDIPLSFITDTLALPYTTIRQHKDGNIFAY
jgi:uncharacterized protein YceK